MNVIQMALFKLAKAETISVAEFWVLNALHSKPQNFLELGEKTGLEMTKLKEILDWFLRKKIVGEFNGTYSINSLEVVEKLVTETKAVKEIV